MIVNRLSSFLPQSNFTRIQGPLEEGLHHGGKRLTPQRRIVLELFEEIGSGTHLSAEQVHRKLLDNKTRVSLATVYRTIRLLVEMGFLTEVELPEGGHLFELASHEHPDHHHLVCISCGRTEEFESESILKAEKQAADEVGFKLIESTITVRAICPKCQLIEEKLAVD